MEERHRCGGICGRLPRSLVDAAFAGENVGDWSFYRCRRDQSQRRGAKELNSDVAPTHVILLPRPPIAALRSAMSNARDPCLVGYRLSADSRASMCDLPCCPALVSLISPRTSKSFQLETTWNNRGRSRWARRCASSFSLYHGPRALYAITLFPNSCSLPTRMDAFLQERGSFRLILWIHQSLLGAERMSDAQSTPFSIPQGL